MMVLPGRLIRSVTCAGVVPVMVAGGLASGAAQVTR